MGQEGRAEEFFEGIDDSVEEFEDEEGFDFGRGCHEEEEVCVGEAEDEGCGVGVWEVYEVWAGDGVLEVEGQQVCRRQRSGCVCVREDKGAVENVRLRLWDVG